MKMKDLLHEWLYDYHKNDIKERTLLRYESIINTNLLELIGEYDVEKLNSRELQLSLNKLRDKVSLRTKKPLSASSINTAIETIKLAYSYANDFEITTNNPAIRIKRIKKEEINKVDSFTKEEQIRIENKIESMNNDEYFGIILVLYTGLRIGELLALTWNDINLRTGIISIDKTLYKVKKDNGEWVYKISSPKSKSGTRLIPYPTFLKEKLSKLKKERKSKYVVCHNDGKVLLDRTLRHRFKVLLKQIKVRNLNFHCLRHTFATRALENNMDLKTLSEILGHASVSTTLNIYAHSMLDHKKKQMRKMKRLI